MDSEVKSLRKQLAVLENEFSQRVAHLERRIETLEAQQIFAKHPLNDFPDNNESIEALNDIHEADVGHENTPVHPPTRQVSQPAAETMSEHNPSMAGSVTFSAPASLTTNAISSPSGDNGKVSEKTAAKPGLFAVLTQFIASVITPLFGPFARLLERFFTVYEHYHRQGKAPVFFMTITGIIALTLGFGYMLQYSFNEYLGPTFKVIIGFAVAVATTVGGVRFTQKRDDMAEYGSSLIALGVVLNYLCAYFAGPYYGVLPEFLGFLLLVAVTAVAYMLALLFETRVVAIVTLVGGATMPLVMDHVDHSPVLYLSYLLVLSCVMLRLALHIRWQPLAWASIALSAGMIELSLSGGAQALSNPLGLIAIMHGFFYAFAHYALKGLGPTELMSKTRLIIVSANLLFYLYISQQLVKDSDVLGIVYLFNVLLWLGLVMVPSKVFDYSPGGDEFRTVQSIALLHGGLLAGVGILMLSRPEMMGVIWCLEGLMLLYLGGRFQFVSVRVEGYIALSLSIVTMSVQSLIWLLEAIVSPPELLALTMGSGWGNLIALTVLIYCAVALLERQRDQLDVRECGLVLLLDNLFSVFVSASFLMTVGIFWPQAMWLLAIFPMFYLIGRAQQKTLFFTEVLGWAHYLLLAVPMVVSTGVAGNFHFSEQSLYGQIARVEAFVCLWLIAEFYRRFCTNSTNLGLAENLRKVFYCLIPVFFLPRVLRQHSGDFPLALWGSSAIALLLYYHLQYKAIQLELRLLVYVASLAAIFSCWLVEFENWQGSATAALIAGLVYYLFIGWLGQGLRRSPLGSTRRIQCHGALKPLFSVAAYYVGIALLILLYGSTTDVAFAMVVMLAYFTALFMYRPVFVPVRTTLRLAYTLVFALFVLLTYHHAVAVMSASISELTALMLGLYNAIAVACGALLVYLPRAQNRAVWRRTGRQVLNLWFFNLITIAAYVSLLTQLFSTMLGPVVSLSLVVHATMILFQTLKPKMKKLIWLSILLYAVVALKILLWDMHDFSLVQKIIVFMLIGLCLLGAAFKFQKTMPRALVER